MRVFFIAIKGTNVSHDGQVPGENRAVIRVVLGAAGAGSVGTPVARGSTARGGSAAEFICSGALPVLVTLASSSVSFREDIFWEGK